MREIRLSGSMSGRWKRSRACGPEPRRGNPDTRTCRRLNYRATSRLYWYDDSQLSLIELFIGYQPEALARTCDLPRLRFGLV
jgi:hypothetical protein